MDSDSLSQQSEEYFNIDKQNFQESLPRLKEFLREADRQIQLRAVKTLLGPCVALCSAHQLGKSILDDAAPAARRLFFETINEVDDLISSTTFNALDEVLKRLECCDNLLESWLQCLVRLKKFEKLSVSQVKSVSENILQVVKRSYEHCKASEEIYGDSLEKSKDKLTILFRKTNQVQKLFSIILEQVIVFNNDVEAELSALAKVVKLSGDICYVVDGMDMKTHAESWKGFIKIAIPYSNDLKIFSPPCVTQHLVSLADSISSAIYSIVMDTDRTSAERSIKLQRHLLKILHKLCQSYYGHLGDDAAFAVIHLLVQLHRYSPSCLKTLNVDLKIVDCIEANFTSVIDQFIDIVISDEEFRKAYFKYQAHQKSDTGFHLLSLILIKKLIVIATDKQIPWCRCPHNILDVTFMNINSVEEELFVGKLSLGVLPLYDATLTSICGLVVSARDLDFQSLEIILLKNLLGGNFWSSIIASDVWCFVDRYAASADLIYDHLVYLMSVYEMLANRGTCIETTILGNLISRLYTLSSSETRNRLVDGFEISKAHFWAPMKGCISQSDRIFLSEMTSRDGQKSIASLWEILLKEPSAEIWASLINQLTVIGTFGKSDKETIFKTVTEIWNCLDKSIDEFDGIHLHLVTQLAIVLLDATQAIQNENVNIYPTLSTLTSLVPRSVPYLRVKVSNYLKESTDNFVESGSEMITALGKLYSTLLEDCNPFSQEEALESLSHTTNASYNEELVIGIVDVVAEVPKIGDIVTLYLSQSVPGALTGFPDVDDFSRQFLKRCQTTGNHICKDFGEPRRDIKRRKLVIETITRPGTPDDIRQRLERISDDIHHLLSRRNEMGESSLRKLDNIVNKVIEIRQQSKK